MARGVTHPSRMPSVAVTELQRLANSWRSHQRAAENSGLYALADMWEYAANDLHDAIESARKRHAEAARAAMDSRPQAAADRVEGVAIARQIAETVATIRGSYDRLIDQTDDQLERGLMVAAKESIAATEVARKRLERAQRALDIICEYWDIKPNEI